MLLDELPLTVNGKVDRRALPAPDGEGVVAAYVAPRNAVEQALCEVWQEVLKRERVGIEDNFFSLGGDSILSIRVVALLKSRGIALGINDIFQHQTIALLAAQARAVESEGAVLEPFALLTEAERAELGEGYEAIYEDAYPMSTLQTGMVFHTQLEQFSGVYHDIVAEHVKCAWEQVSFEQALTASIEEHPVLRTVFRLDGERPLQLVRRAVELPLEVVDLREQADADAEQYVQDWVEARKRHVFDWEQGPLWQLNIFLRTAESFQFVLSFHHAVLDGWSRAVLTTELYNRYQQLLQGQESEPVTTDWTYRDFIAQEQRVLADEAAREYFARLLEGAPSEQLPRLKAVSTGGQPHGSILIEDFRPLSEQLLGVARELGVPVQAVLLAGHFKVLSTLSGQTKALSCVTHNGRPETAGGERSLGLYLNSLPQALELDQGSWRDLINEVAQLNAASMSYRGYPLSQIQQETGLVLNEITFNYTHFHVFAEMASEAAQQQPFEVLGSFGFEQTNFDFHVDVARWQESLSLMLIYNPELYERELMERVHGYYQRAYEQLLTGLDQPHQAQSLLSAAELEQVAAAAHGPAVEYTQQCIHEQIREQAQQTPEAVAVVYGEQTLSYAELDEKAERLARYLVAAGVGVESRVGLYLRRSPELLIGVLGVLKAGAAYVPLEPGLPSERVSYMLADAQVEWVLVESEQMAELPLSGVDVVLMDGASTDPQWLAESSELDAVMPAVGSEQLAYILYTSGSTGRPKGVMVEHGGLGHYLGHAAAAYLTAEIAGSVVSSPLSFDATLTTLLAPLLVGRRVELLADDERLMEQLAERLFSAEGNQLFKLTPAHLEALQYVERPQAVGTAAHVLVLGGEQLSAALLRRWKQELLPRARFVNEYGPTEAVVGCSVWWLRDDTGLAQLEGLTAAPIGRPIGNTELYVLGAERQLLPWQSVGELYIGGAGVARGYLNQAELTAARFIESPFGSGRLYRTGDLVRWLGSGELQFMGRSDDQVKLRGFRIELGEIEQQLETVGGVKAAVVLVREDEPGRKRLVAYVVPDEYPADEEAQALLKPSLVTWYRDELALRLPHYMVPTDFVLLTELPLTPNGKVDRRALPAPDGEGVSAEYVAPRNAVEQALCEVWQEVLNRDQIGIEDNFFSLGGDSILSIRVVALLKSRGIALGINDIFQHQTIALLAAQARAVESEGAALEPFALLTAAERAELADSYIYEDAYPMSTLQTGMVFHTQLEQFSGVYHDIVVEHVKCAWDQVSFEQALAACVAEHPVLRTVFRLDGERPLQLVRRAVELPLEVVDLRAQVEAEAEQYVQDWVEARKRHVFDWEQGPLWQLNIFLRTEESFQFVLSFHHAVLDGWSRAVLTTELYNRYQQLLTRHEAEAVTTDWTYRDFIAQEQRVLADEAAREYFARLLEGAPSEQLPRQQPVSTGGQPNESIFIEEFRPLSTELLGVARELGVPIQAVLLAGHFKVLSTLSGQSKALSCVTHSGRPETAGAERSLGLYLNSLPQALELGQGSWRDLINHVAQLNAASMSYRGYPLSQVQQETGLVLNEVTFNYTHFHVFAEMTSETTQQVEVLGSSAFEQTNFDFHVDVTRWPGEETLSLMLIYNPELYERELMERVSGYYQRAYEQLLTGLDQPHRAQSLLSAAELEQVAAAAHGPAVEYTRQCIHEQIREQAQQTPEAVAVVYGEQTLSYAELDARSDRLARYLVAAGVGVESRVGLYLRRSPELLIGVLGVLKAGAAYVPLEPGLPSERVSYMLADARVEWVLVESEQMAELPLSGVDVVLMDGASTDSQWLAESSELDAVTPTVGNEQLAYILYTSGSTGRPKGVMVEHGGLGHYLGHAAAAYLDEDISGSVVSSPLSFDATLTTLLAPLLVGRRVELLADDERLMEQLAARLFAAESNQLFKLTPAHLEALQYVERLQAVGTAAHVLVLGGEQLSAALLRRWKQELLPRARFVNEYGPTEAVVGCSVWWLRDETGLAQLEGLTAAPIGRPIGNTELYVLGAERQLLPWQSVGELYIGGAGVARGYLNQAELTAARFIDNPFSEGGRLYRTGDLVRWLGSGELQFVGRSDDQVKLRGFRIELGEIEQQLETVGGVKAAVVLAREDEPGRKRLVAYVAVNGERQSDAELSNQLRQALQTRLPEYMVPSAFVLLDELPLTPNGKVDRRALPAPDGESQLAAYVAPRNAVEQALCEVWQEVLKRERVGIDDNFFSLGGDSILSIRVVALLKSRGLTLGINEIFQHQTVALLAAHVTQQADSLISKMSNEVAEQKVKWATAGKTIEEGIF